MGVRPATVFMHVPFPVSMAEVLQKRVPTMKHVPLAVQGDWERPFFAVVDNYVSKRALHALARMMSLAKLTLSPPRVKGRHSRDHTILTVRHRLQRFMAGDLGPLWTGALESLPKPRPETRAANCSSDRHAMRARSLLAEGALAMAL